MDDGSGRIVFATSDPKLVRLLVEFLSDALLAEADELEAEQPIPVEFGSVFERDGDHGN